MKKTLMLILAFMLTALALAEAAPWTREGTFTNENGEFLTVKAFGDAANPDWYVGCVLGEAMAIYGGMIGQEGDALRGNIDLEGGEAHRFSPMEIASIKVTINTDGLGLISYAEGSVAPSFDGECPAQSAYLGLMEPATYTFAAKADDGYRFVKWTRDGKTLSTEAQVTVELNESADYVAVFREFNPYAGEPVSDIDSARTLGDVLGLPNYGYSATETACVTAVELNDVVYRVEAAMDEQTAEAFLSLEFDDPDYQKKFVELLSPLSITKIVNLTRLIPSQDELNALIGQTGDALFNDGWTCNGWDAENQTFLMNHGPFSYTVTFDGNVNIAGDFEEDSLRPLTVASILYEGIGDATSIEE